MIAKQLSEQPEAKSETQTGWVVHYVVEIAFAYVFFMLVKFRNLKSNIVNGLFFGMASVSVRCLFFTPALGNDILANKPPNPRLACSLALMMHSLFGLSIGVGFSTLLAKVLLKANPTTSQKSLMNNPYHIYRDL